MTKFPLLLASASLLAATACVDPNAYPDDPNARQKQGIALGALAGAALGASQNDDKLAKAMREMIEYGLTEGQKSADAMGYIPLPAVVVEQVRKAAANIK